MPGSFGARRAVTGVAVAAAGRQTTAGRSVAKSRRRPFARAVDAARVAQLVPADVRPRVTDRIMYGEPAATP